MSRDIFSIGLLAYIFQQVDTKNRFYYYFFLCIEVVIRYGACLFQFPLPDDPVIHLIKIIVFLINFET